MIGKPRTRVHARSQTLSCLSVAQVEVRLVVVCSTRRVVSERAYRACLDDASFAYRVAHADFCLIRFTRSMSGESRG